MLKLIIISLLLMSCTPNEDCSTNSILSLGGITPHDLAASHLTGAGDVAVGDAVVADMAIMSQLVGCALRIDQQVTVDGIDFPGNIGLAPGWLQGGIGSRERELVTGCLLAHLSADGLAVVFSMRAHGLPRPSSVERSGWPVEEGAFFGDLLSDQPTVPAACRGAGQQSDPEATELANRVCAEPDPARPGMTLCGLVSAGPCADACERHAGGRYERCRINGGTEVREAVTTFVSL